MTAPRHVFIVGCSRSGTTAFAQLLGRHGKVVMGIERYITLPRTTPISQFGDEVFTKTHFFTDIPNADRHAEHYTIQEIKFASAKWIGDKVPSWLNNYAELKQRYPDAVVFCMLRDPASVGLSWEVNGQRHVAGYWAGKTFRQGVKAAASAYGKARKIIEAGDPDFHLVRYDGVFPHDVEYLSAVLERLELQADDNILNFYAERAERSSEIVAAPRSLNDEQKDWIARTVDADTYAWLIQHAISN